MSISVTFSGNTYSIPESGEVGWSSLTDYLVALANAATATGQMQNVRVSTAAATSVLSTDWAVLINYAGAATVTLPTGVVKTVYVIGDTSGAAATNNITISTSGAQTIEGATDYYIQSNYGAVVLQFNGTTWQVIGSYEGSQRTSKVNATNGSYVDGAITPQTVGGAAGDLTASTVTLTGCTEYLVSIALSTGEAMLVSCNKASASVSALSDQSSLFLPSDSGTGIVVTKTAGGNVITVKNRMGGAKTIEIKSLTARVASATAWA